MAGVKITDLGALSIPDGADKLYIVDVSDTSESPQGTSKQTTVDDILALVPAASGFVESVTGDMVDNTDPINPVINRPYQNNWVGKISQTGTADPTITYEFENTLGAAYIHIARQSTGYYKIYTTSGGPSDPSVALFGESNTFVLATPGGSTYNDCFVVVTLINSGGEIFFYNYGNGGGVQDVFTNMYFEIRVY
jgi:hypothetical protein